MAAEASNALSETGENAPARARCNPMSLSDRTIAITGGAQGIGLATAHLVADLGGNPVLVDMNADTLAGACKAIGAERCLSLAGAVSDPSFAPDVVERAKEIGRAHGRTPVTNAQFATRLL